MSLQREREVRQAVDADPNSHFSLDPTFIASIHTQGTAAGGSEKSPGFTSCQRVSLAFVRLVLRLDDCSSRYTN